MEGVAPVAFNPQTIISQVKKKIEDKTESEHEARDTRIADITRSSQWEPYKEAMKERVLMLKSFINPSSGDYIISAKDSVTEVGYKFLLVDFAVSQIEALLDLPEALDKVIREQEAQEVEERTNEEL